MEVNVEKLKGIQREIAKKVELSKYNLSLDYFELLVGIDLAFLDDKGIVCFSIFDTKNRTIKYFYEIDKVDFPYIPTFLAFRELPLINKLYNKLKKELGFKTLFFVDGHGLSHPRKAGIATHFGVENSTFSIGLAKKMLYGKYTEQRNNLLYIYDKKFLPIAIRIETATLGRKKIMGSKELFVSVGNKLNLENAFELFWEIYKKYKIILTELSHNYLQSIKKMLKLI